MKILITAGATWVAVDSVRILTNRFTGRTGRELAEILSRGGHRVTLLINPRCPVRLKGARVINFRYFEDFLKKIKHILSREKFDLIVHSAAVSDYKLKRPLKGKIPSGEKALCLKLVPTEKIIKTIRKLAAGSILVQFKLEADSRQLIAKAYQSLRENKSDFVVAHALSRLEKGYRSYLVSAKKTVIPLRSRKALASSLAKIIGLQSG